jgi:hypothetical protein
VNAESHALASGSALGLYDKDVRPSLLAKIRSEHSGVVIFEELPLCRRGRADIAAVNAFLWGYEIKSERDTLNRLPIQVPYYDSIFDFSNVVTTKKHYKYVRAIVPAAWGIIVYNKADDRVVFDVHRKPRKNGSVSLESLIKLLWKDEAIRVLRMCGISVPHNALVSIVWDKMATLPKRKVALLIRETIKLREERATDLPQTSYGDSFPIATNVVDYRIPLSRATLFD